MPNLNVGLSLAMTIGSSNAGVVDDGCTWAGDFYSCLITRMIDLCQNNNECYGYDELVMFESHRDEVISFCLGDIGGCVGYACSFFNSYSDMMAQDAATYATSYAYDLNNTSGEILLAAQRAIELGVMDTLLSYGVCWCEDTTTEYLVPRGSFGAGLECATCPNGGTADASHTNFTSFP
ncbi:MAG: hypothetical protein J6L47_03500, partial [Alphaproteobacteria bacterium]|nr:hypothetical protein [Alphaproteobacteria bacterium]